MRTTDVLDEYLDQLRANGRSPLTVAQAGRHVQALVRWTERDGASGEIRDVTHQHLARFLIEHQAGRSASTVNAVRSTLRSFFCFAEEAGYVDRSPARLVRRARTVPPPPRALSEAELERLVTALDLAESWLDRRDRALFRTMLGTGIRLGAALALRVDDVDLDAGVVDLRVGKGGVRSRLPIAEPVRALLAEWIDELDADAGPLFPNRSGTALSSRQAQARLRTWLKRAGITSTASPHTLRHCFALRLLRRTGDLSIVQRALTHRSIASTVVYARADDAALRAALGA